MTTDSDKPLEQVIQSLDAQNSQLSDNKLREIRQVRQHALAMANQPKVRRLSRPAAYSLGFSCSVLLAVVLWANWQPNTSPSITVMPKVASVDVPAEDLALLEELEFATWLAENENQLLL
jgi:hypothetical protein